MFSCVESISVQSHRAPPPLFPSLQESQKFHYGEDYKQAFLELKTYRTNLLVLVTLKLERHYNSTLPCQEKQLVQSSFVTEATCNLLYTMLPELCKGLKHNTPMEKLALALITSARRHRPYFKAHPIYILTDVPLKQVLLTPKASGHFAKWIVELEELEIEYLPCSSIKEQLWPTS